jgi:hypothetical protein
MAGRPKGIPKTGGRKKGTPNKITKAFREAVLSVFGSMGGEKHLLTWARQNPTEFYKIAARLIPTELTGAGGKQGFAVLVNLPAEESAPK